MHIDDADPLNGRPDGAMPITQRPQRDWSRDDDVFDNDHVVSNDYVSVRPILPLTENDPPAPGVGGAAPILGERDASGTGVAPVRDAVTTHFSTRYVRDGIAPVERLLAIMASLRDPDHGCEWDRVQTFATIAPYTIEEAYEVADACARGDLGDLKDELGDLLLQVVFHSRIAEEAGAFVFADVAAAISDKMERRHPHIFGDVADGGHHLWETVKAEERRAKGAGGTLDGVATGLPALLRAEKLQKRAARTGFDWPDASGAKAKIAEEIAEIEAASNDEIAGEVGDLLFSVVNWARHLGVDPEGALRQANAKFERRFKAMEAMAGDGFAALDLDAKEALWADAKREAG